MALTVIPSIDLRHGKVVRLQQGDYARQLDYAVEPIGVAANFAAAGATWMHVVDLDGAKEGRPVQVELISRIVQSTGLKVQVGGGVRSTTDVKSVMDAGASRAVVGTRAMQDWEWFRSLVFETDYVGKITLAIDAKDGVIATHGWTETSTRTAIDVAREVVGWPLAGLLYTDVARDGMMTGPNFEQTIRLAESTDVPVIASGGVGSIEHVHRLVGTKVWGVIIGRSLYEGAVDLAEAIGVASGG